MKIILWILACIIGLNLCSCHRSFTVYSYQYQNFVYDNDTSIYGFLRAWGVTTHPLISSDSFFLYQKGRKVWQSQVYSEAPQTLSKSRLVVEKDTLSVILLQKKGSRIYYHYRLAFSKSKPLAQEPGLDFWEQTATPRTDSAVWLTYRGQRWSYDPRYPPLHCDMFLHEWQPFACKKMDEWKMSCETYVDRRTLLPVLKNYCAYWCYNDGERTVLLSQYVQKKHKVLEKIAKKEPNN